jgi:transcriptional regulator with XRE-family HTH domain
MTIGERVQKLRKASKMTQGQLADKIGVSDKAVSKWENEGGIPDIEMINSISNIFGISLDFLMKGNEVTAGDKKAVAFIAAYEEQKQAKSSSAQTIIACKRLLTEHGIEVKDDHLPKLNSDKTGFDSFGVFDSSDTSKFSLSALLSYGLSDATLKLFADKIDFDLAVSCDSTAVFKQALENYFDSKVKHEAAEEEKKKSPYYNRWDAKQFQMHGVDWALENLNSQLTGYYACIVWLIDNGASYYKEHGEGPEFVSYMVKDKTRTDFFYRVAKDMEAMIRRRKE